MIGHYLVQSRLFRALHGDQSYPFRFLCGKPGLFRAHGGQPGFFRFPRDPRRLSLSSEILIAFQTPLNTQSPAGIEPFEIRRDAPRRRPVVLRFVVVGKKVEQELVRVVFQ